VRGWGKGRQVMVIIAVERLRERKIDWDFD